MKWREGSAKDETEGETDNHREKPLQSWKEISAHLERGERTAQRWEKEAGLPVRRHHEGPRSTVYAYPSELDAWRAARKPKAEEGKWLRWSVPVAIGLLTVLVGAWFFRVGPILNPPNPLVRAQMESGSLSAEDSKAKFTKIRIPAKLNRFSEYALSPDGQQLAYLSDGSVWLVPVHGAAHPEIGGQPRRLTEPQVSWKRARSVAWSRDARWIALHIWEHLPDGNEDFVPYIVSPSTGELRRIRLELKNYVHGYWDPNLSLSPDGKWLAYSTWGEGEDSTQRSIYLAPTVGGAPRRLTQPIATDPAFSPDGTRIAYVGLIPDPDRPPDSPLARQVWVVSRTGGKPVLVYEVPRPARLRNPTWSPDGERLAFLVCPNTDWAKSLVFVTLSPDGNPSGTPTKINLPNRTDFNLAGWGADNKIGLLFRTPEVTALYTVPASGGMAFQLTPKAGWMPNWAPDGKRIYFDGSNLEVRASIEFVSATGGKVERIPLRGPHQVQVGYPSGGVSVSPDGKKILFSGAFWPSPEGSRRHLFTVPVDGGNVTSVLTGTSWVGEPCWSPDGTAIAFIRAERVPETITWLCDIYTMAETGGQTRKLTSATDRVTRASKIVWSPDGKNIAFRSEDGKLKLVPVDGGASKLLAEGEGLAGYRNYSGLAWSPDGKALAHTMSDKIWRLSLDTGKSEEVQTGLDARHTQLAWSPDGTTLAFSATQGGEPELWLMEDFGLNTSTPIMQTTKAPGTPSHTHKP